VITEKQIDFDQIESVRAFDGGAVTELAPGSLDNLEQDIAMGSPTVRVKMDPDAALQLLGDPNASLRADAALSFVESKDIRSVIKLICLLQDPDDEVRKNSIESLTVFGNEILPFLEVSLVEAPPRTKQGILEVIRLSGVKDFDIVPFLGKELEQAYGNLLAHYRLETLREDGADSRSDGVEMLRAHLLERNEEALSLIFYALWVYHADMRLMYQALRSESASLAIELIETSIQKDLGPYLIPLIEDVPVQEKIDKGRKLFPLIRNDTPERLLTRLAHSDDTLTCILALYVIGQRKLGNSFVPIVESRINDSDPEIVEAAAYALETLRGEVAPMPDSIVKINTLGSFGIFEGMGVRELHAIASIMNIEQFEPGDVMIREGEQNSSIYLIVSGRVTVYGNYGLEDQKEKVTLGEGAFLGELSLFTRMAPNATCVAADTTVAYVLRHHQFQEIMKIYPQIGINLCRFFTMKLRMVSY
jgi:hypothetical protein